VFGIVRHPGLVNNIQVRHSVPSGMWHMVSPRAGGIMNEKGAFDIILLMLFNLREYKLCFQRAQSCPWICVASKLIS